MGLVNRVPGVVAGSEGDTLIVDVGGHRLKAMARDVNPPRARRSRSPSAPRRFGSATSRRARQPPERRRRRSDVPGQHRRLPGGHRRGDVARAGRASKLSTGRKRGRADGAGRRVRGDAGGESRERAAIRGCRVNTGRNSRHVRTQRRLHHVGRTQPSGARRVRKQRRALAEPRRARRGRHAVRERLLQLPDLRSEPGELRDRPLRPQDRLLGQRISLSRHAALHGATGSTRPGTAAIRSASFTIAAATIRTASTTRFFRCMC